VSPKNVVVAGRVSSPVSVEAVAVDEDCVGAEGGICLFCPVDVPEDPV
jgi:hypothetical protein